MIITCVGLAKKEAVAQWDTVNGRHSFRHPNWLVVEVLTRWIVTNCYITLLTTIYYRCFSLLPLLNFGSPT
jgi:hypothetical protein